MQAHRSLIKSALNAGYSISVYDGEDEYHVLTQSQAYDRINDVEEAWLTLIKGEECLTAYILPYGVDDEETVADWGTARKGEPNNFIDDWSEHYYQDPKYVWYPAARTGQEIIDSAAPVVGGALDLESGELVLDIDTLGDGI